MDIRFEGKRALVTGAGKGIGRGITKALAAGRADTVALSRTQADLDELKAEIPGIRTVCVDLTDWAATKKAVEDIGPIDLLVNNAVASVKMKPFLEIEEDELNKTFAVNINAVVNVSQVVARGLIARGEGGAIVNMSSTYGHIVLPDISSRCISKAALDQVTRVMTLELGPHQIRVNSVNPSRVTKKSRHFSDPIKLNAVLSRTPLGKFAEVKDVVHAVLYLLSDKADMINGTTMFVDGGLMAA